MRKVVFVLVLIIHSLVNAQDDDTVLTLEECIESALNKNLNIKRSNNDLLIASSNKRQAYYNFLPNLNASINYNLVEGSGFDNNSGQFVTTTTRRSAPSVNSNVMLFNAFSNHHLLNRRTHEYNSANYQLEDSKIAIQATVIRNYLNVLLDKENLRISKERLDLLESQLEREKKRESVGVGNLESVYNFQSQVATERLNMVNLENLYRSDLLSLLQSIQLNDIKHFNMEVAPLDIEEDEILLNFDAFDVVLKDILNSSFRLKSAEEDQIASKAFLSQSRSDRYPTLSAGGSIGSNYSSNNVDAFGDYFEQMRNLNFQAVGVTLSIPIFNRFQTQNSIETAKVSLQNAELQYEQALLDVTNAAQSDYLDLRAAQTQYVTARDNFDALNQTFEFSKKRFETGNTDFYTYLQALNNKNRAEAQLANAKYTIVLRKRILDLYRFAD
jgi:outer membrane protein